MQFWAHMLVKNEARWLWYSVMSVVDHVNKILLYDSGSTDGSLKIEEELSKKYPKKIILKKINIRDAGDFTNARQAMLDETLADWFIVVDGDEIWWEGSMRTLLAA